MIKVPATPEGVPAIRTLLTRGHQRQRHAALLEGSLRGGGPGLRGRPSRPASQGPARGPRRQRGQLLREPHRQRGGRAARGEDEDGHRPGQGAHAAASWARSPSPTPRSPTRATRRSSPVRAGSRWPGRTRRRSACSGPARAPRTRATATPIYVEELIGPTPSTPSPRTRSTPSATTASCGRAWRRTSTSAMDVLDDLEKSGISLKKVTDDLLADGLAKFVDPFAKLLKAVERRCRDANKARINEQTYTLPAALESEVDGQAQGVGRAGRHAPPVGGRRLALDGHGRGELDRLDRHRRAAARRPEPAQEPAGRGQEGGLHPRAPPRHGRLQPLSRGLEGDVRPRRRLPGAARPRLHRSRAGEGRRGEDRPRQDAVHRLEQVRLHARAQHLQGLLLRQGEAEAGRQGGQPLRRRHRSRLQPREGGARRRLPPHLPRREVDRRPLLRAVATSAWCRRR